MNQFSPDNCHIHALETRKPLLSYRDDADYGAWKAEVIKTFHELIGDRPEPVDLNIRVEWEEDRETYTERRFIFDAEYETSVPCHLLLPKEGKAPYPLVICLQGHSTGMHISLGRAVYEGDEALISGGDRDFALQIVHEGYAALCIEQRGFGERKSVCNPFKFNTTCHHPAYVAMLLGRTLHGERAFDISRAIDAVSTFPEIDMENIALMGNSGGGTSTYYTTALEPRIRVAMPSCAVCSFSGSIAKRHHCDCNYIPRMAKYMDMGEVACMIAPRPLIVVAGQEDCGFDIAGVHKVYEVIQKIYEKEGAPENCKLIVGPEGHRFYADLAWGTFRKMFVG